MSDNRSCGTLRMRVRMLGATALAATMPAGVFAQTAPASAPATEQVVTESTSDSSVSIGDIVVTAQKRAENIQNVPVAVQVVDERQLQAAGVRNFADLSKVAPSLVVRPAEQPVNASVSIRGIGTFAYSVAVEPSVAVQVDDVPIAFQARAFTNLADVERMEVLRGPQSTLYGKSSSAGLINIVTKGPTKEFRADVSALATSDDEYQWNLGVSGPLTDTLGFRVLGNWTKYRGNVLNVFNNSLVNGREDLTIRGKLRWEPIPALVVDLGLDYVDGSTTLGRPLITITPTARLRGNAGFTPAVFAPGIAAGPTNTRVANNFLGGTEYHDFQQALRVSYDLDFATFMSISSHDKYHLKDSTDNDDSSIATFNNDQTGTIDVEQITQEFRLISPGTQPLRYTLGLFYADVDYGQIRDRGPLFALSGYTAGAESIQKAAFAQLDYDLIDNLTVTGGIRYGEDKVSYTFLNRLNGQAFAGSDTRDYLTYRANVQYKFSPAVNVFATFATGRKGQTYDLSTGFDRNRALAGAVEPETSKDWEVGLRSQAFDRRLTFNLTAFTTTYKNFQAQGIETLPDGSTNFRLANVGRLRTRGIEAEVVGRPTDELTLRASGAYVDARIQEFPGAACFPLQTAAQGCIGTPARQNLSGFRPPQAPVWKGTADAEYARNLGESSLQGVIGAVVSYQSKINFSLNQDPLTVQGQYATVNLTLGVRSSDQKWQIMGFVNNLTDKHYYNGIQNNSGNYANQVVRGALLPRDFKRYFGVRANYNY